MAFYLKTTTLTESLSFSLLKSPSMAPHSLSRSPIFGSTASPYTTAPSSPKLLTYSDDSDSEIELLDSVCSFVPFNWEEKPGKPKTSHAAGDEIYDDIAFEFCVDRLDENFSLPAEDLFDGGKIRPLKPPPGLQLSCGESRRSVSHSSRRMIIALSSRWSYGFIDPFEAAIESARRGDGALCEIEADETASFSGSRRFKRLRNLIPFWKLPSEGGGKRSDDLKANSGSSSASGSVGEPENGFDERSLTPFRRHHLFNCCFMDGVGV